MTGLRAVAAWPGPALVTALVAAVAAGSAVAPVLVVAAAVGPLLAVLQPARAPATRHPVTLVIAGVVAALVLWAHLAALADAAALLGAQRWQAAVTAAAVALIITLRADTAQRARGIALAVGGGALLAALVGVGAAMGVPPWAAWAEAAARPALVFSGRSPWVIEGARFVRSTTLAFVDGHRVVAVTPGTFRVVENDGGRRVVRDWRLSGGDTLSLRPGDTVMAEAGSGLRFEPGKRVPGAPPSGSAWADAPTHASPPRVLATLVTLVLGACALVSPPGRRVIAASAVALALSLGAVSWGVYATLGAPEAGLAGSPVEALLALGRSVPIATHERWPGALTGVVALGLLGLFVASADGLRQRITEAGARWREVWIAAMLAATVGATVPGVTPWTPLLAGLGLAGAAVAAPRLAGADGARIGSWRASVVGGLAGAAVFCGLAAFGAESPAIPAALHETPVLVAAPAAWLVVKLLRREAPAAR